MHEIGNKIPKVPEWHNSGSCCLSTNAVMFMKLADNLTLLNWLELFAHPFLANHVYKVKTGTYANGEFEHFELGIIQGYFEVFQASDELEVVEKLRLLTGRKDTSRNALCFCNSGKKYKRCYLVNPSGHSPGIPISVLQKDLSQILNYMRKRNST